MIAVNQSNQFNSKFTNSNKSSISSTLVNGSNVVS